MGPTTDSIVSVPPPSQDPTPEKKRKSGVIIPHLGSGHLANNDVQTIEIFRRGQADWQTRSFGVGTSNTYDMFLVSNTSCGNFAVAGCYADAELILPDGYESAWLCNLHSVSADGGMVYCTAALRGVERIDYFLSQLSLADRRLTPITKLEAVFV